ncbi:M15 family metallopeptidase [Hyphomicrobium sp. B1]|uniref:M15 family metallopeptidase n=1 Tax=Hyphomicrobium sp. B1 TaxID=3075651 RepID=UPI003C2C3778
MLQRIRLLFRVVGHAASIIAISPTICVADGLSDEAVAGRLAAAYPDSVAGLDGRNLKFRDGTTLPLGSDEEKPFETWLAHPSIKDMFRYSYPQGAEARPPKFNFDPGRARNTAFFTKLYGDCQQPGFAASLTTVRWLPGKANQRIMVTRRNGVAAHLQAVSDELDALPARFAAYLIPSAGGFVCRTIAGTARRSGHGYGIAIDIATTHSHYWRWAKGGASQRPVYRNAIPLEIVRIFEKHGFIWGGRWYHYDTMHFEYRPELLGLRQ